MNSKLYRLVMVMIVVAALAVLVKPSAAQETIPLPLAEPGPYAVGMRSLSLTDTSRDGRKLDLVVWYPAIPPVNPDKKLTALFPPEEWGWQKAMPDLKGAPYPLILYSPYYQGSGEQLHDLSLNLPLASHGFVVAGLSHLHDDSQVSLVDRPLDILFVIDQLAALKEGELAGLIDADHVGVMGFSSGAWTTLAVTGARIDPTSIRTWISKSTAPSDGSDPRFKWNDWDWDKLVAYRARSSPLNAEDLWPPFTDSRIKGALLFAACKTSLFGDRGLAAATVPTLIVAGTADMECPYEQNATYAYAHLGSRDRYLLSEVNKGHAPFGDPGSGYSHVVTQFTGAFFGYYLQGRADYAQYLTAKYVDSVEALLKLGLVWGPYQGK
ncbi:MAG TPA: hypothetical protein VMT34_02530 [Aggregatilineales bacterium]|nr:hypothetical protein [Aggregatilineales bacterium]